MKTKLIPEKNPHIVPYLPDQLDALRWFVRESFEVKIHADGLELVEYTEADVDPSTIPPKVREWAREQFGTEPLWRSFRAVAKLPAHIEALLTQ